VEYVKEIGKGWFGKVFEARIKRMNPFNETTTVIVKQLSEDATTRDQVRFLHEARMYRDVDQPNVLELLYYAIEKSPFLLIFERWPLGDLKGYLRSYVTQELLSKDSCLLIRMAIGKLQLHVAYIDIWDHHKKQEYKVYIFLCPLDIAKAMEWMEASGFVHADLSGNNTIALEGTVDFFPRFFESLLSYSI
jgi:serine/threonine protein kinase